MDKTNGTIRRLTLEEYRHISEMWGQPLDSEGRKWDPKFCTTPCWACEAVSKPMAEGKFKDADTEDGIPVWLLPDIYRPADADELMAEWLDLMK